MVNVNVRVCEAYSNILALISEKGNALINDITGQGERVVITREPDVCSRPTQMTASRSSAADCVMADRAIARVYGDGAAGSAAHSLQALDQAGGQAKVASAVFRRKFSNPKIG